MNESAPAFESIMPASELASVFFSLLLIVGLIFALAWLVRRFGGAGALGASSSMRVVSSLNLGAKEKVVVVKVGDQQLLLGVTPHQITKLAEVDIPQAEAPVNFADKLQELLPKHGRSKPKSMAITANNSDPD